MKFLNTIRLGLAAKLAICVVASTAAFFGAFGYINPRAERAHSEDLVRQSAYRITDVILRSTHYGMLHNDRDALYNIIRELGASPASSASASSIRKPHHPLHDEIGAVVDTKAEACYACHAQSAPLTRLNRKDRARRFTDKRGRSVLAVVRPIENAPEMFRRRVPRTSRQPARARGDRCESFAGHGGCPGGPTPGPPGLVPGRRNRFWVRRRRGFYLDRGPPAGQATD
jgi:hypothetical protein